MSLSRRAPLTLLSSLLLLAACGGDGSSASDTGVSDAASDATASTDTDVTLVDVPIDTAAPSDTLGDSVAATDTAVADAAATDAAATDTATADTGPPPPPCGQVTFSLDPDGSPAQVLVTGSFSSWAAEPPGATALGDSDGDGVFTAILVLEPGSYQYKFIVDGSWIADPGNPNTVDDGFGGHNSVLDVPECGAVSLADHTITAANGGLTARFTSGDGAVAPSAVTVTVDWIPAPGGAVASTSDGFTVSLTGLAAGIHDVRVTVDGRTLLLKVYIGVSTDWRDALLYFVMTDRFVNGDAGNDAPIAGVDGRVNYQGGDFAGVIDRIEDGYFDALGVGALWLSWPIDNADGYADGGYPDHHACGLNAATTGTSPMKYTAYHGYWPSHTDQIEARFGTLAELRQLVTTAHAHGIRVVLDFTANHVHEQSPVYQQHKDDGWFNLPIELCQDVGWDTKPRTCWFTSYLPDLNYDNPAARAFMVDHAVRVIEDTGADGFRLDAVKHIALSFVTDLRARLAKDIELTGVPFWLVGETFSGDVGLIDGFVGPDKLHGQFDFPSNLQILKGLAKQEIGLGQMDQQVRSAHAGYKDGGRLMSTFIGNHDIARFTSMAAGDIYCGVWDVFSNIAQGWHYPPGAPTSDAPYQQLELALAYAMTIPGVPLIYYGDEVGMPGAGDPDNRRMMRFGAALSARESATLAAVRSLGLARRAHPALSRGDWPAALLAEADLLAYARTLPTEKAIVILNRGGTARSGALAVSGLGVADGVVFHDALGAGAITVSGGQLAYDVGARSVRILVAATP
ncbi:MAG: hypothetical protein CVU56_16370 [Deltaproteobacteria bacterium HGW-Deltaproteobacteria-14]|jgi:glycosidase|nr:MAG: hypothetical protein CVU56_16370 [Deltaproteobacteria bacterium HGW-Deltaproteobacteria-14]